VTRLPLAPLAIACLLPASADALTFERERVQGLLNLDVSYGLGYRMEDADPRLIGVVNGGTSSSVNGDDANLNFENGTFAHMVRGTGELVLGFENVAFYSRAAAFHDWVQDDALDRTELTTAGKDLVGSGADLLDHYLGASLTVAGAPVYVRLGDQIVNWSGTSFVRDGLDLLNPFDGATLAQPASQSIDTRKPQGMLWFAASPTRVLAIEGYYQYEWEPAVGAPVGSYYSTTDLLGGDGVNAAFLGGGSASDLGTDLDARFALPPGTLGFDENFDRLPGRGVDRARDGGQYGVSLFARFLDGLATKIGLNYIHYHSRLPILSGVTGSADAVAATSASAVAARADQLTPAYLDAGLDPAAAAVAADTTARALVASEYMNAAGFYAEYPEDIDAVGASLSFSSVRTGTLYAAEVARHFDVPYQLDIGTVLNAVLSPIEFDPAIGSTGLGEFGADANVRGYRRADRTQGAFNVTQILGPRLRATQMFIVLDVGAVHVHDAPGPGEVPYQGAGRSDDSWGYRLAIAANYSSVFGGVNLQPRIAFARDVDGTTPGPTATFVEGRQAWSFGIGGDYLQRLEADLSYTRFSGGGAANALRDRDALLLRLTYSF